MKHPIPLVAYHIYMTLRQEASALFLKTRDLNAYNGTMKRLEEWAMNTKAFKDITNEVL